MTDAKSFVTAGAGVNGEPLLGWQAHVRARLVTVPPLYERPAQQLHAEVLRIHGRLLLHLARHGPDTASWTPLPEESLTPERLGAALRAAEADALARGVKLPLADLVRRFGLGPDERELLLLALARAVASGTGQILGAIQGAPERDIPTVAFATALLAGDPIFTPPPERLFGAGSRLLRAGLLRLVPSPGSPSDLLLDRLILPSNAVVAYLCGTPGVTEPLTGIATLVRAPRSLVALVADDEVRRRLEAIATSLDAWLQSGGDGECDAPPDGVLALVSGAAGSGKTVAAEGLAGSAGKSLLVVSGARLAAAREPEALIEAVYVQAGLLDAVVCLRGADALLGEARAPLDALLGGARRHRGLTVLTSAHPERLAAEVGTHLAFQVELDRPDADLRVQLWESELPPSLTFEGVPDLTDLAVRYELNGRQIRNAVVSAYFEAARRRPGNIALSTADLACGAREQLAARLEGATARRGTRRGLDAIVLPDETARSVQEFLDACAHRTTVLNEWGFGRRLSSGKGIVALFDGEPGTGKTFCAELIANELGLVLQTVAVPQVMSKWVGETEQNIARLFGHARAQNTLLMFDEADALFTTRVKVERSIDRFSNMEVNQLLQEIDRFEGVVILTTNLESSIDRAFKRRIGFHIKFPLPDARVRAGIWNALLPPEAPLGPDVDFEDLAERFDLAGGHIKNILVRAAYRASARATAITLDLLEEVAEDECRAAGKLFRTPGADFSEF